MLLAVLRAHEVFLHDWLRGLATRKGLGVLANVIGSLRSEDGLAPARRALDGEGRDVHRDDRQAVAARARREPGVGTVLHALADGGARSRTAPAVEEEAYGGLAEVSAGVLA